MGLIPADVASNLKVYCKGGRNIRNPVNTFDTFGCNALKGACRCLLRAHKPQDSLLTSKHMVVSLLLVETRADGLV